MTEEEKINRCIAMSRAKIESLLQEADILVSMAERVLPESKERYQDINRVKSLRGLLLNLFKFVSPCPYPEWEEPRQNGLAWEARIYLAMMHREIARALLANHEQDRAA